MIELIKETKVSSKSINRKNIINLSAVLACARSRKKYSNSHIKKIGFTIVEISIVLVIIGLIIGGIMVGQTLIRASEIRSIVTQKEATVSAVYTFKDKFNAIPGDMKDAQNVWGAAADCSTAETTTATCNGTGNGLLDSQIPSGTNGNESFLFWKHLANAGLIPGNYWGIKDGANPSASTSNNSASGKINNSLWYTVYWGNKSGQNWVFDGSYGNVLEFGVPTVDWDTSTAILTPQESFAIDSKFDDGEPGTGNLRSRLLTFTPSYVNQCTVKSDGITTATNTDTNTAIYKTNKTGNQCILIFTNIF